MTRWLTSHKRKNPRKAGSTSDATDQSYTGNNIKTKVNPMGAINGPGILTPKNEDLTWNFHM